MNKSEIEKRKAETKAARSKVADVIMSSLTDSKPHVKRSAYDVILETLAKQVKTKKNKYDWGELDVLTEVDKEGKRKYITVENQCVGFCFNMRGDFLGMYNWKD
jgi:hypothetical protein